MKIEMYVVVTGNGTLFGPFVTANLAAKFLAQNYSNFSGHSRIECVWSTAIYSQPALKAA